MPPSRPDRTVLIAALKRFNTARVLVVGDILLDRYRDGTIERLSQESGVPVLRLAAESSVPGGAGNVASNIAAMTGAAAVVGTIGDDEPGATVRSLLAQGDINVSGLVLASARRTPVKTRYRSGLKHLLRADDEVVAAVSGELLARLLDEVERRLADVDVLVLSDYGKGTFLGGLARELIARARAHSIPVVVDPKGADYARYRGADVLTPNLDELAIAAGRPVAGDAQIEAAARDLMAAHGIGAIVATRGADGVSIVGPGPVRHLPANSVMVEDPLGAGDTFVAALALAIGAGLALADAAGLANAAAAVVAGKQGTATASLAELEAVLTSTSVAPRRAEGVQDFAHARKIVGAWRDAGLTVGFTNGCFDVLHAGHVHALEQAKAASDRLVVGLNTDLSVRRLKGEGRPIHSLDQRARVLLALRAVDMVVPFAEPTPIDLIDALSPDVLVKGSDYRIEEVVGANLVLARGGRVLLVEMLNGLGTTATLKKLVGASE